MNKILREMIHIYKPIDLDWMNYKVNRNSDLTIHHIVKQNDGGITSINNSALLIDLSHQYLNLIEFKDYDIYVRLNMIFTQINMQRHQPSNKQRELVEELLTTFEVEHKYERNSKGKKILQYKYLQRW